MGVARKVAPKLSPKIVKLVPKIKPAFLVDRPSWIPAEITENWDTNPFAYQTEEELMAAGGSHGTLLAYIIEVLRVHLKQRGVMLLLDVFLLYRNEEDVKRRIAPDLLLTKFLDSPLSSYDLDTEPAPRLVVEMTSPDSHIDDLENKVSLYLGLGIQHYLIIDAITPNGQVRRQIQLHLWRLAEGQPVEVRPDGDGGYPLPELGVRIATRGQKFYFIDLYTGVMLLDTEDLSLSLELEQQARITAEEQRAEEEKARIVAEEQRAEEEKARHEAETEVKRLREELSKYREQNPSQSEIGQK